MSKKQINKSARLIISITALFSLVALDWNVVPWIFNFIDPWIAILSTLIIFIINYFLIKILYEKFWKFI